MFTKNRFKKLAGLIKEGNDLDASEADDDGISDEKEEEDNILTDSDDNTVSEAYESDPFFDYEIDDEIDKLSEPHDDARGEGLSIRNRDPKGKYFYDQSEEEKALGMDRYNRDLWADNERGRPYDDNSEFPHEDKKELKLRAKKLHAIHQINKYLEHFGKRSIHGLEHESLEELKHTMNMLRNIVASHKNTME